MATPQQFARDWVFNVIKPFLTQLKNRLGNIKLEKNGNNLIFTNQDAVSNTISVGSESFTVSTNAVHDNSDVINFGNVDNDYITIQQIYFR